MHFVCKNIMMMVNRSFFLQLHVFLFLLGAVLHAQEPLRVSLVSAVDSAMKNNTLIRRYRQAVAEKEQMRKASAGNFFPSVDVIGGYTYISENPEVNMSKMKESIDEMFGYLGFPEYG